MCCGWPCLFNLPPIAHRQIAETAQREGYTQMTALKEVLKRASYNDGLAKGLREACKAIDKRQAYFCVLADNCDRPEYKTLIAALCKEAGVKLIKVADNMELGEWVGLAKYDKQMKVRKRQRCSCVVVRDYIEESEALSFLLASSGEGNESA